MIVPNINPEPLVGVALAREKATSCPSIRTPKHYSPATIAEDTGLTLHIEHVSKVYKGNVHALNEITLDINPGILGLLGPNGAGKSSLMRILATITKATSGRIRWNDVDIAQSPDGLREILGYLPQDFGVYPNLSAFEFLEYMAAIKGLDSSYTRRRIAELLEVVNLGDARKRPLGSFSGGMKQRVGIAQALLNNPRLLIVDEPTAGLDPEERVRFRNLLSDLSGERIVILSTHIVSDVEATATDIAIISHGRLLTHSSPESLLRQVEGKVWEWTVPTAELPSLKQRYNISTSVRRSDGVKVRAYSDTPPSVKAQLVPPGLEDAYLSVIAASRNTSTRSEAA